MGAIYILPKLNYLDLEVMKLSHPVTGTFKPPFLLGIFKHTACPIGSRYAFVVPPCCTPNGEMTNVRCPPPKNLSEPEPRGSLFRRPNGGAGSGVESRGGRTDGKSYGAMYILDEASVEGGERGKNEGMAKRTSQTCFFPPPSVWYGWKNHCVFLLLPWLLVPPPPRRQSSSSPRLRFHDFGMGTYYVRLHFLLPRLQFCRVTLPFSDKRFPAEKDLCLLGKNTFLIMAVGRRVNKLFSRLLLL